MKNKRKKGNSKGNIDINTKNKLDINGETGFTMNQS